MNNGCCWGGKMRWTLVHAYIIYGIVPQFSPQYNKMMLIMNDLQFFSIHCMRIDRAGHGGWRPGGAYPVLRIAPLPVI